MRLKALSILILAATLVGSCGSKKNDFATALKPMIPVRQDLTRKITLSGKVTPKRKTLIVAPFSGYIQKIYVKQGQLVAAQQPLVTISQTPTINPGEVIYPLRAPFGGTVVQLLRSEGEFVDVVKDSSILRIDDVSQLWIQSDVPELHIGSIQKGQAVQIRASAVESQTYQGLIREIALASKDNSSNFNNRDKVEFPIQIEITQKGTDLKPGMSVIVDVIAGERKNVLTLPHEYVEFDGKDWKVTLTDGQSKVISIGLKNEQNVEVTQGITEKDLIQPVNYFATKKTP